MAKGMSGGAKVINPSDMEDTVDDGKYTGSGAKKGDGLALDAKQGIKQVQSVGSKTAGNSGSGGISKVLEPEKNADEFAKGMVGHPDEMNELQAPNNEGLGDTTLIYGGGYFERETPGLEDGISIRQTMNGDETEPNYNYDIDPLTGSAPERKIGRTNNYNVTGKRGNTFKIGEM